MPAQLEELLQLSGRRGCVGRPMTRHAQMAVSLSERLAFLKSVKVVHRRRTRLFSPPLSRLFAAAVLGLVDAKCGATHVHRRGIISRIFPADDKPNTAMLVPRLGPLAESLDPWFSCALHAYARLHTPRMSLLSDVLFSERLARQGPFLHCSSVRHIPIPCLCKQLPRRGRNEPQ